MINELEIFKNNDYQYISNFIENKSKVLRRIEKFNTIYTKNINLIEELDKELKDEQKLKFNYIINSIYELEEYYYALAYSLGIKYGEDLKNL